MDTNHSPIISPLTMRESARGITVSYTHLTLPTIA